MRTGMGRPLLARVWQATCKISSLEVPKCRPSRQTPRLQLISGRSFRLRIIFYLYFLKQIRAKFKSRKSRHVEGLVGGLGSCQREQRKRNSLRVGLP